MSRKTKSMRRERESKSKQVKKIVLILVLAMIVVGLGYVIVAKPTVEKQSTTPQFVQQNNSGDQSEEQSLQEEVASNVTKETKETTVTELEDGTLYSVVGNETIVPDIVIGDNYFDTQLSDIYTNFSEYKGKTMEIEGFYLENTPYTFVGRYSEANLCAYCPVGYSYFEYEWHGDKEFNFTNEKEWLKIVGTIKSEWDQGEEYYYLDVLTLEVMKEPGVTTVKN